MRRLMMGVLAGAVLAVGAMVMPSRVEAQVQNLYAAGLSGNAADAPHVSGTGAYLHALADGTYAGTVLDVLPAKGGTVTTNVGAGVVQKLATIADHGIYGTGGAAISWTGSNTGWKYDLGFGTLLKLPKDGFYLLPMVRVAKASVGGAGYQPVVTLALAWGK